MQIIAKTRQETLSFGEKLGKNLIPGDIVLLFGELGVGKTTLAQGIANGLGLRKGEYTRSPTFTIINEYKGRYPIYHIDLYRLNTFSEVENLGLEEILSGNGVCIIEWAEKLFPQQWAASPLPMDGPLPTIRDTATNIGLGIDTRIEIRIDFGKDVERIFQVETLNREKNIAFVFPLL